MRIARSKSSYMAAIVGSSLSLSPITPASAAASFAGFAGNWRGTGTITMSEGAREKIRCRGTYVVRADNEALSINLLCASDSYKVNIISNVAAQPNGFSGQWQETTKQVQGSVTGRIPSPGQLQADLQGTGFGMQFSARVSGNRQVVSVQAQGTEVQSVNITMSR